MRSLPVAIITGIALLFAAAAASAAAAPVLMPVDAKTDPTQFVVVTVANPQGRRSSTVGGTARGYQGGGGYRASPTAVALVRELSRDYALTAVAEWPIEQLQVHCIVFRIAAGTTRDEVLRQLQSDDAVIIAQPLNEFASAATAYDDPYATLQINVDALDVVHAHQMSRGRNIRVAVIDTAVDAEHPDLSGRVEIGGNYVDAGTAMLRNDRHGTQVAGLIAAAANNGIGIVGVAPEVNLLAFKACWYDAAANAGRCNSFTLAQALVGAIDARVDIINLSLIGPADPLLAALVGKAAEAGAIVVGAAGRDPDPKAFPSGLPQVLAVAEAEAEAEHADPRLLRAPGRDIVTLVPGGHYDFASGSSLATAQVSGVIALLLARHHRLHAPDVLRILQASTQSRPTSRGPLRSINACAALSLLLNRAGCSASTE
jgi:subtilisin family serine protease